MAGRTLSENERNMSLTASTSGAARRHAKLWFAALLGGSMLGGVPTVAMAQEAATTTAEPEGEVIKSIAVAGAQRLEPQTILAYIKLRVGQTYSQAAADEAIKDLYATELFSSATITNNAGDIVIQVTENPIINRIVLEGNKRLKDDKIRPEIKLAPRQIFTRSKVRADVARIIELYKRQGRFAASVEPQMVQLDQNRVDIIFEITEGPKSKVRQINIIGNEEFSDGELRSEMVTKQSRWFRIFSSGTSYDPDRLAFDQQKLRQFYLTEGYADFRVVSAVAELTPDKRDFIITYVVEEGERYKFGDVSVESQIRDFDSNMISRSLSMKTGDWYNAKLVEDTVEGLTETAGTFGYAFANVRPSFTPDREKLTMDVKFTLQEAPRVYIERVDVNGNTLTQDKVVRREFRVAEGDAFNSLAVRRSTARINSLGFFQENFEIDQKEGSQPDRIILEANVQEQPTGELQLSAGFSSLESFLLQASIRQRNFRGRGQTVGASVNWSRVSKSASLSFTEPALFDKDISAGVDIYRRDYNNRYYDFQTTTYEQTTNGLQLRAGVPLSEYLTLIGRYTFNHDKLTVDEEQYFTDYDGDGQFECTFVYICDSVGTRTSSILGASLAYSTLDSRVRPTRGMNVVANVDFAGLGGSVKYIKGRVNAAQYWPVIANGFIFSVRAEGGIIHGLEDRGPGLDPVRLPDRFFLGEPQIKGFDIRGVGPRIRRRFVDAFGNVAPLTDNYRYNDALGGNMYYMGRAELEIPLGTGARELGLRPSIFLDVGAVFGITEPNLQDVFIQDKDTDGNLVYLQPNGTDDNGNTVYESTTNATAPDGSANIKSGSGFYEEFLGDSPKPRIAVGVGVNWNSPFGPFRIDFAHVLSKVEGDETKKFTFSVGTQF